MASSLQDTVFPTPVSSQLINTNSSQSSRSYAEYPQPCTISPDMQNILSMQNFLSYAENPQPCRVSSARQNSPSLLWPKCPWRMGPAAGQEFSLISSSGNLNGFLGAVKSLFSKSQAHPASGKTTFSMISKIRWPNKGCPTSLSFQPSHIHASATKEHHQSHLLSPLHFFVTRTARQGRWIIKEICDSCD